MTTLQQTTPITISQKSSVGLVMLICALFLATNLVTGTRSPRVWHDEIMFVDPAINLASGHGFRSTAWPYQTGDQLFCSNAPLFSLMLAGWFRIVGFGALQARSLDYVFMALAGMLLVRGCRRWGLIRGRLGAGLLLAMVFCAYGLTFSYRSTRYDPLCLFLCAGLFLASTLKRPRVRRGALLGIGILCAPSGLQLLPFLAIISLILLLVYGRRIFLDLVAIGIGSAIGLLSLIGFFAARHVLRLFINATASQSQSRLNEGASRLHAVIAAWQEHRPTLLVAIALLVLLLASPLLRRETSIRKILWFGLIAANVVCPALALTGHYLIYYSWMGFVPAAVALAACTDRLNERPQATASRALMYGCVVIALLACYGLPGRVILAARFWRANDLSPLDRFVADQIRPADVVFCDFPSYFGARTTTWRVDASSYGPAITPTEAAQVSLIITNPLEFADTQKIIGGTWVKVGEFWPTGVTDDSSFPYGPAYYHQVAYRRGNF